MFSTGLTLLVLALSVAGYRDAMHSHPRMVHHNVARRPQGDVGLHKRYSSTRWSFYDVGLGACGKTNVASDFIVALNAEQFGSGYPGVHCFKTITLNYKGKTAEATIMDSCPGCPYGGLDLSRGLFKHFASEDEGIIFGDWSFTDGAQETTTTQPVVAAVSVSAPSVTLPTILVTPTTASTSQAAARNGISSTSNDLPILSTSNSSARPVNSTALSSVTAISAPSTPIITTAEPNTTSTDISSAASYSSSAAAMKSSAANIASSFSSFKSSPTVSAAAAVDTANTTALIEDHLEAITILLASLEKMIEAAGLRREQD